MASGTSHPPHATCCRQPIISLWREPHQHTAFCGDIFGDTLPGVKKMLGHTLAHIKTHEINRTLKIWSCFSFFI